jgi:hypothetical protein
VVFANERDGDIGRLEPLDFLAFRDVLRDLDFVGFGIVEQDMFPAPFDKPLPIAKRTRTYPSEIGLGQAYARDRMSLARRRPGPRARTPFPPLAQDACRHNSVGDDRSGL